MKRLLFLTLFILSGLSINAQKDSDDALLKKLVEKKVLTQSEADDLSKESQPQNTKSSVQKVREAFHSPYIKFNGYGLLWYRYTEHSDVHHSLSPRVIFISMTGQMNNFKYFILADFVNPTVHEFWGEWSPRKELAIRGGQMKVPFSLENQMSLIDIETVSNTRSVSSLIGMADDVLFKTNGKNNGGRDIGVTVSGKLLEKSGHELIQYNVGMFQGSGINTAENNNHQDFSGSLMFRPISPLRIGGSTYFGETVYAANGETDLTKTSHIRNRWMLSSDYQTERFYARAEWMHGNDAGIKKEGLYGTALYYVLPKQLNVVGKVDYYNNNKDINSEVIDYTAAVNYYFYKGCRLQLNYTFSDYSDAWGAKSGSSVQAQMQVVF